MGTVEGWSGCGRWGAVAACVFALAMPAGSSAQSTGIDSRATELLKASTSFLANQKQFSVETRSSLEVVLASGQKIQFDQTAKQLIQRPNKLRVERMGDLVAQVFYYDGKSLTLSSPGGRHYATVPAPGTLEDMLDFARTTLDIVAPAGDLVYRNAYEILMDGVTDAFVVGKSVVEGVRCNHLAFRAQQVDWQIWIQEGSRPLPCKMVITTRDLPSAPQFSVVMTRWNLKPPVDMQTFNFVPASDSKRVEFVKAAAR